MDFLQGKIYKITSTLTDKIYIGSTCKDLKERLKDHKANYINHKKGIYKGKVRSFELMDLNGNVKIELLEACQCDTKRELLQKEYDYIKQNRTICLNKNNPIGLTPEEQKDYHAQYYTATKSDRSVAITCALCQGTYSYYSKYTHFKSKKHLLKS